MDPGFLALLALRQQCYYHHYSGPEFLWSCDLHDFVRFAIISNDHNFQISRDLNFLPGFLHNFYLNFLETWISYSTSWISTRISLKPKFPGSISLISTRISSVLPEFPQFFPEFPTILPQFQEKKLKWGVFRVLVFSSACVPQFFIHSFFDIIELCDIFATILYS